jgi:cardiolipin synthase
MLTVFRMVLIPVFVTLLFYQRFLWALGIFVTAGLTDGLDGLLARRFAQQSQLGTILDPIADKLMLVTAFIVLSMRSVFPQPLPGHLPIPFWVTIAVISRDVFIIVGAAAINMMTGFKGFRPSWLGKLNTTVQIGGIAAIMFAASVPYYTGYYLPFGLRCRFRPRYPLRPSLHLFRLQTHERRPPPATPARRRPTPRRRKHRQPSLHNTYQKLTAARLTYYINRPFNSVVLRVGRK